MIKGMKRVTYYLTQKQINRLDKLAEQTERKKSQLIRDFINEGLNNADKQGTQ